ncbi:MAG: hypothetical protein QOF15_1483 [Mycobacterium sp.]|nr:hypothetical protein [Mycobacterium sp.]
MTLLISTPQTADLAADEREPATGQQTCSEVGRRWISTPRYV